MSQVWKESSSRRPEFFFEVPQARASRDRGRSFRREAEERGRRFDRSAEDRHKVHSRLRHLLTAEAEDWSDFED